MGRAGYIRIGKLTENGMPDQMEVWMSDRQEAPYGSWRSPISVEKAVAGAVGLGEPRLAGRDVYWTEGRPTEKGRQVIVRWSGNHGAKDVNPPPFNARTMVHEYGGGAYAIGLNDTVYFSNLADGRIYRQERDQQPVALTQEGAFRYADLVFDVFHHRIVCVREDHSDLGSGAHAQPGGRGAEPTNTLVSVDAATGAVSVLADGYDFYSSPRPYKGERLAWLSWRHPNMPWDATELWVADVDEDGRPTGTRLVAGGADESIVQPEWAPDGSLVFVSDRSGWWNLYRWTGGPEPVALAPTDAEFAGAQWVFGLSWYAVAPDGVIFAAARRAGRDELWTIPVGGPARRLDVPDEQIHSLQAGEVDGVIRLCYLGGGAAQPTSVVLIEGAGGPPALMKREVLQRSFEPDFSETYISRPEHITYPTSDGEQAHALFYPPTNPDYRGAADERPPLVVTIHGGPTSYASGSLSLGKLFFTSRGIAVVDIDYRGSTGYGREYMRRLDGNWGIYDVDDTVAAARYLAERGDVDPRRMAIRGGSAGGYTTLAALAFHDVFAAGASFFGVGDLEALARDTHKFESRYLDRLVAPYPSGVDIYRARSPIYFTDQISSPLLVLQGTDDMVVPIAQAEQLVKALEQRRIPHAYIAFAGEGHGFRQAANIRRSLEAEISFYAQLFGFELADDIEPIKVEHLS